MKLSLIFSFFVLLVACSTSKQLNNSVPVAKISNGKVFYSNGKKGTFLGKGVKNATVIYLVRHAEKAKEGGRDPLLTKEGTARALRLKAILEDADIDKVYATAYQRTQLTAAPTANAYSKTVQDYDPRDLKGFAKTLRTAAKGNSLLVVGHSNTTPTLVNELIGTQEFPMIEESEYGDLFVVTISEAGSGKAVRLKY